MSDSSITSSRPSELHKESTRQEGRCEGGSAEASGRCSVLPPAAQQTCCLLALPYVTPDSQMGQVGAGSTSSTSLDSRSCCNSKPVMRGGGGGAAATGGAVAAAPPAGDSEPCCRACRLCWPSRCSSRASRGPRFLLLAPARSSCALPLPEPSPRRSGSATQMPRPGIHFWRGCSLLLVIPASALTLRCPPAWAVAATLL